ncbi:MAG: 50S ribosome-binding GTPase [Planctomycetes bacterium]|nr:50S ribosome-binding GTPase [Planctomycetota bacterium]
MSAPADPAAATIAAVSTAPGRALRSMIRLSGAETYGILSRRVAGIAPPDGRGGRVRHAPFRLDGTTVVPTRIVCFRAPRSYTGEDLAEVHVAGNPALTAAVLGALFREGARPAGPGEFTRRAYLAGRIDLVRAEGVQALIAAADEAGRRGALTLTGGRVAARVEAFREALITLLSDLEATLDFDEHEVEADLLAGLEDRLGGLRGMLGELVALTRADPRPAAAPRAILWGRPNAGKSTLLNRLIGRERVATDAAPGTTRDVVGARLRTPRGEVLLFDAPGIGPAVAGLAGAGAGEADAAARRTAAAQRERMDLCVVVADVSAAAPPPDPGPGECLLVLAKVDLARHLDAADWIAAHRPRAVVEVSALAGIGLDGLRAAVGAWLAAASAGPDAGLVSSRLGALFGGAVADLGRLAEAHASGLGAECLSVHVRALLAALEEVTGRVFTEDLLDRIFARFCIGK